MSTRLPPPTAVATSEAGVAVAGGARPVPRAPPHQPGVQPHSRRRRRSRRRATSKGRPCDQCWAPPLRRMASQPHWAANCHAAQTTTGTAGQGWFPHARTATAAMVVVGEHKPVAAFAGAAAGSAHRDESGIHGKHRPPPARSSTHGCVCRTRTTAIPRGRSASASLVVEPLLEPM